MLSLLSQAYAQNTMSAGTRGTRLCLNLTEEQKHDYNQQEQSQPATGIISPASAMRPTRQRTNKRQHQDYDQYGSEHVSLLIFFFSAMLPEDVVRPRSGRTAYDPALLQAS
jgi:hypothetical protein